MLSIFSCFRKKTPPKNIEAWLDQHFPGQFEVLVPNLKMLDVMAQFKGEKQAVVSVKADPEVEFLLDWEKGSESLGLSTESVNQALNSAKADVEQARELFKLLENKGLGKYSVSLLHWSICVQIFAEPTPAVREHAFATIRTVLETWVKHPGYHLSIEFMEPDAYQVKFQNIIPRGYFQVERAWQKDQMILSLSFRWDDVRVMDQNAWAWEINSASKRGIQVHSDAFLKAQDWAEENLQPKVFMDSSQLVEIEFLKGNEEKKSQSRSNMEPSIRYAFPYFDKKPDSEDPANAIEPTGHITVVYCFDQKVFLNPRRQKEN